MKTNNKINVDSIKKILLSLVLLCAAPQLHLQAAEAEQLTPYNFNDDDDLQIILDADEIYPLVDYDTICTDYEIQDYIESMQTTKEKSATDSIDLSIPDLPQAPESIAISPIIEKHNEVTAEITADAKVDSDALVKNAKKKKYKRKRCPKLSKRS